MRIKEIARIKVNGYNDEELIEVLSKNHYLIEKRSIGEFTHIIYEEVKNE